MSFDRIEPSAANDYQATQIALIAGNHLHWTGRALLPGDERSARFAHALYEARFVLLAHDTAPDPIFFYANRMAQHLFEMSWGEITTLPSRCSAEPVAQAPRQNFLDRVTRDGFVDDYAGIRISKSGLRFHISGATVWNLHDDSDRLLGQAAAFSTWEML